MSRRGYRASGPQLLEAEPDDTGVPLPLDELADVRDFAEDWGITQHLQHAWRLAQKWFPSARSLSVRLATDPDVRDEWVAIKVTLETNPPTFPADYRSYMKEFVRSVPASARSRIQLTYGIASQ